MEGTNERVTQRVSLEQAEATRKIQEDRNRKQCREAEARKKKKSTQSDHWEDPDREGAYSPHFLPRRGVTEPNNLPFQRSPWPDRKQETEDDTEEKPRRGGEGAKKALSDVH